MYSNHENLPWVTKSSRLRNAFSTTLPSFSNSTHFFLKKKKTEKIAGYYILLPEGISSVYLIFLKVTATDGFRTMSNLIVGAFARKYFTSLSPFFRQKASLLLMFWPKSRNCINSFLLITSPK